MNGSRFYALIAAFSLGTALSFGAQINDAAAVSNASEAIALGKRVANAQLFSERDWVIATKEPRVWKKTEWGATALWAGVLELYKLTQDRRYLESLMDMGASVGWQPQAHSFNADMHSIGQIYVDLHCMQGRPEMIAPIRALMDEMVARNATPIVDNSLPGAKNWWSWSDSLFMSPPILFRLAKITGEKKYFDYADKNWWLLVDEVYDSKEHLLFRDATAKKAISKNGKKVFWARGDGWVFASLARILPLVPAEAPSRARYETLFRQMAQRLVELQQPGGYWTPSLLDPEEIPQGETSGTAFFCYGLTWGLNQGVLQGEDYQLAAQTAWKWLCSQTRPDGTLVGVQPVGSSPVAFDPATPEIYGAGAFLLAACEMARHLEETGGTSNLANSGPAVEYTPSEE